MGNEADLAALASLRDDHVRGVNTRDVELVLRDYAEDLVYLSHGMQPVLGKDALRALITPLYEQMRFDLAMAPERIDIGDDTAFEWGYLTGETAAGPEAATTPLRLRYVLVYRRRPGGSWEINCAMTNEGALATGRVDDQR